MMARTALVLAFACTAPTAKAATVSDAATGLRLDAPAGYTARKIQPRLGQDVRFEVKTASDRDTGCQVVFTSAPQNNGLSQAEIDTGTEWQDLARSTLERIYDVLSTRPFAAGSRRGVVITGDFKERANQPPRAREIRSFFVIEESPRGRTTTVCVGERDSFGRREAEFMAVAVGVIPP